MSGPTKFGPRAHAVRGLEYHTLFDGTIVWSDYATGDAVFDILMSEPLMVHNIVIVSAPGGGVAVSGVGTTTINFQYDPSPAGKGFYMDFEDGFNTAGASGGFDPGADVFDVGQAGANSDYLDRANFSITTWLHPCKFLQQTIGSRASTSIWMQPMYGLRGIITIPSSDTPVGDTSIQIYAVSH